MFRHRGGQKRLLSGIGFALSWKLFPVAGSPFRPGSRFDINQPFGYCASPRRLFLKAASWDLQGPSWDRSRGTPGKSPFSDSVRSIRRRVFFILGYFRTVFQERANRRVGGVGSRVGGKGGAVVVRRRVQPAADFANHGGEPGVGQRDRPRRAPCVHSSQADSGIDGASASMPKVRDSHSNALHRVPHPGAVAQSPAGRVAPSRKEALPHRTEGTRTQSL